MKQALLIIAHGSRRATANQEVTRLARQIMQERSDFICCETGFLELASPDILQAIQNCVDQGAEHVVVIPYFLAAGRHVVIDIPAHLEHAKRLHQHVTFSLTAHLGISSAVKQVIHQLAATETE